MDTSTELALRAVIRGLCQSKAIDGGQVRGVVSALKAEAGAAMDRHEPEIAKALVALCKGIRADQSLDEPN